MNCESPFFQMLFVVFFSEDKDGCVKTNRILDPPKKSWNVLRSHSSNPDAQFLFQDVHLVSLKWKNNQAIW